tara:strand:- start:1258 stop:2199 length:942 start_codon:yes stop_codon:yes gene_type:complete
MNDKEILLLILVVVVIFALIYIRKKDATSGFPQQFRNEIEDTSQNSVCPITVMSPDTPAVDPIPVLVYSSGPGGFSLVDPNPPDTPSGGWYPNLEIIFENYVLPDCTPGPTARNPGPDTLTHSIAGEVQLSAGNSNPNGGYIMISEHAGLDHTLDMTRTPYATLLTQAEVDGGAKFNFFPTFRQEFPSTYASEIEVYAVSDWVNLNATSVFNGDVVEVSWDAFTIPENCTIDTWEIAVSVRDDSVFCSSGETIDLIINVGEVLTDVNLTTLNVQLLSGTPSPIHNLIQVSAFAYPVSNKSTAVIVPVALASSE